MHVICSPTSGRRHWGTWDVTDVREGKEIYSDYTERFFQAFPAEVCFVLNYDVVMKALIDVFPKWMRAYLHKVQQQVSDAHRQCRVLIVTSVMELLFLFELMVHQMSEKGKELQLLQQQLLKTQHSQKLFQQQVRNCACVLAM